MKMMKKHDTRKCEYCEISETTEHVFIQWLKYREGRQILKKSGKVIEITFDLKEIWSSGGIMCFQVFRR